MGAVITGIFSSGIPLDVALDNAVAQYWRNRRATQEEKERNSATEQAYGPDPGRHALHTARCAAS